MHEIISKSVSSTVYQDILALSIEFTCRYQPKVFWRNLNIDVLDIKQSYQFLQGFYFSRTEPLYFRIENHSIPSIGDLSSLEDAITNAIHSNVSYNGLYHSSYSLVKSFNSPEIKIMVGMWRELSEEAHNALVEEYDAREKARQEKREKHIKEIEKQEVRKIRSSAKNLGYKLVKTDD